MSTSEQCPEPSPQCSGVLKGSEKKPVVVSKKAVTGKYIYIGVLAFRHTTYSITAKISRLNGNPTLKVTTAVPLSLTFCFSSACLIIISISVSPPRTPTLSTSLLVPLLIIFIFLIIRPVFIILNTLSLLLIFLTSLLKTFTPLLNDTYSPTP